MDGRSDRRGAVGGGTRFAAGLATRFAAGFAMRSGRARPGRRALALAAIALVVAGCSSGVVLSKVGSAVGDSGGAVTDGRGALAPAPAEPGTVGVPEAAPSAAPGGNGPGGGGSDAFAEDAKIVKTGTLTLEVTSLDDALAAARTAIAGLGGYVSGTNESNDGDRTEATIVYRIPAARWDEALGRLRGLATKVVGEQTNAVEVTGQVIDLEARISNLRATESALQAIMAKAVKISDVLEVQSQLTVVQGEIEQLSAQKAHLEDQAALGTLTVSFGVPVPAVTVTREGWDPAAEVDRAVASLVAMLQGVASLGIWFAIVALPVLLTILVALAFAVLIGRRLGLGRGRPGTGGALPPSPPTAGAPSAPASEA